MLGSFQAVYGGGSGSEESDVLFINDNYFKVKLETNPSILEGDENQINFDVTTINDDTQQVVSGVEYTIEIFDSKDNLIVEFDAYSPDEKLETLIVPNQNVNFSGETADDRIGSIDRARQKRRTVCRNWHAFDGEHVESVARQLE